MSITLNDDALILKLCAAAGLTELGQVFIKAGASPGRVEKALAKFEKKRTKGYGRDDAMIYVVEKFVGGNEAWAMRRSLRPPPPRHIAPAGASNPRTRPYSGQAVSQPAIAVRAVRKTEKTEPPKPGEKGALRGQVRPDDKSDEVVAKALALLQLCNRAAVSPLHFRALSKSLSHAEIIALGKREKLELRIELIRRATASMWDEVVAKQNREIRPGERPEGA